VVSIQYTTLSDPKVVKDKSGVSVQATIRKTNMRVEAPGNPKQEVLHNLQDAMNRMVPASAKKMGAD